MKDTSLEAYRDIIASGRAGNLREKVLLYIWRNPGCTQIDISRAMGESARKRVSELISMPGVNYDRCSPVWELPAVRINGRKYTVYKVNPEYTPIRDAVAAWKEALSEKTD